MKYISFDHGTASGYAVFQREEKGLKLIQKGFIQFNKDTTYDIMYDTFLPVFKWHDKDVECVFLEKINIMGAKFNADAIVRLCEIRAIIKLLCHEYGIRVEEVNPMTLKKFVTCNGRATKEELADTICDMFDLKQEDVVPKLGTKKPCFEITDSIGIGYTGICKTFNNGEYVNILESR